MRKALDLRGQTINNLQIIEPISKDRKNSIIWKCKCSCGNICSYSTDHLTRRKNPVKSCGCLKKLSGPRHKDWKGHGEINRSWWSRHIRPELYQKRNPPIKVEIDIEYIWNLFLKQERKCALTGINLKIALDSNDNTASLDRIDSSIGYVDGNVQWVHKHINFMKRIYSQDYFIEMCKKVAEHNK
jgi:hypothetical protein